MRHPTSKHIYAYWRRLRGLRTAPERSDINPAALGRHLSGVFILDRDDAGDHRFRVAGSDLCALFGQELRGTRLLSIATHTAVEDLGDILKAVTEDVCPVIAGASALLSDFRSLEAELLLLPLRFEGTTDRRVLGGLSFRTFDRLAAGDCHGLDILSFRTIGESDSRMIQPKIAEDAHPGATRRGHLLVLPGGQP